MFNLSRAEVPHSGTKRKMKVNSERQTSSRAKLLFIDIILYVKTKAEKSFGYLSVAVSRGETRRRAKRMESSSSPAFLLHKNLVEEAAFSSNGKPVSRAKPE